MAKKTNRVELSEEQRSRLLEWVGRGERPAREQRRARVLLKADEGPEGPAWSDERIAEAFELSKGGGDAFASVALRERLSARVRTGNTIANWMEKKRQS